MRWDLVRDEVRETFRLAAPLAAAQGGQQLMSVVDIAVVGRLGAEEVAGVGAANAFFFVFMIIAAGVVMGVEPLTAQA
ncbi:MAG TPA: MATE family efflux transporter, partial [Thermoanaerobaculia bacterium]